MPSFFMPDGDPSFDISFFMSSFAMPSLFMPVVEPVITCVDRNEEKRKLEDKLAMCGQLASEYNDGVTGKNLRDLADELEQKRCALKKVRPRLVAHLDEVNGGPLLPIEH